ncbi:hypothetical protein MKZ38_003223 [Zalerion maritima]|uniref:Uncharacterized protein n=1 Tax=Zalerion maritima TaxID=339359 RepID=A0AAD5WYV6_9PEZI|nr:hypothetical protein MKZ38_003223 [Zalerion maritima]
MTDPNDDQLAEALIDASAGLCFASGPHGPDPNQAKLGKVPMNDRATTWTSPSSVNPQQESPLFSLPSELRERIWLYALTKHVEPPRSRTPHQFNYRGDQEDDPREEGLRELLRYDVDLPPLSRVPPLDFRPDEPAPDDGSPTNHSPVPLRTRDRVRQVCGRLLSDRRLPLAPGVSSNNNNNNNRDLRAPTDVPASSPAAPQNLSNRDTKTYDWYRPGYEGIVKYPGVAILRTCRRIYLEASALVGGARTYTFWLYRAPPGQDMGMGHYFNTVVPLDQKLSATDVRLFVQMYELESGLAGNLRNGGTEPPAWQAVPLPPGEDVGRKGKENEKEQGDPEEVNTRLSSFKPPTPTPTRRLRDRGYLNHVASFRLSIRRGDWRDNERNQFPQINPFSGGQSDMVEDMLFSLPPSVVAKWKEANPAPQITGNAGMKIWAHHAENYSSTKSRATRDYRSLGAIRRKSWARGFAHLPNLETLTIDLEHSEDKLAELRCLALWARLCWWFPAHGGPLKRRAEKGKGQGQEQDKDGDSRAAGDDSSPKRKLRREFRPVDEASTKALGIDPEWSWRGDANQWSDYCTGCGDHTPLRAHPTGRNEWNGFLDMKLAWMANGGSFNTDQNTGGDGNGDESENENKRSLDWDGFWRDINWGPRRCPDGWCPRKRKMMSLGLGPRIYGFSIVYKPIVVEVGEDEDE